MSEETKDHPAEPNERKQEAPAAAAETPAEAVPPAGPAPAPPSNEELAELRRKAAEHDALMDRLKRVTADYLNSQKRLERRAEERVAHAIESFARELLPVADNLGRALVAAREHASPEKILEGVELVEKELYAVMERHGIRPLEARTGDALDTAVHDAISVQETEAHEPNRVIRQVQKGFRLHNRLLRPARVVVSGRPREETKPEHKPTADGAPARPKP